MDQRPIFVAAHPRAISTAFERVFMTQRHRLTCIHEPFGDAFYYGPERMSERFEADETTRLDSGFAESTYQTVLNRLEKESSEGKRLFIKDIIYYLFPPNGESASIAPSIAHHAQYKRGVGTTPPAEKTSGTFFDADCPVEVHPEPKNPTVIPEAILRKFHFAFLIRHPRNSIPSFYRCTIPPLEDATGFHDFMPNEAGYTELRRLFEFLRSTRQVGPDVAGQGLGPNGSANGDTNGTSNGHLGYDPPHAEICVIDADDLLDDPEGIVRQFCDSVDLEYDPSMLVWDSDEDYQNAHKAFEKWNGWHNDVLESDSLKPRVHKKQPKSDAQVYAEWVEKYGEEGAKQIQETVDQNVADYEYLKQFSLKLRN